MEKTLHKQGRDKFDNVVAVCLILAPEKVSKFNAAF